MRRRAAVTFSFVLLLASAANAGGTVEFSHARKVLAQSPHVLSFVTSTLDVAGTGTGVRVGAPTYTHLGGLRIGPYTFEATPKGHAGGEMLELIICTQTTFIDAAGAEADPAHAVAVREKFLFIEIRDVNRHRAADCP